MRVFISKHVALILMAAVAGGAVVALRILDPATSGVFPPCPLRALTGWYCPGCGSLRAFHQLLLGNLRAAFAMNPLAILSLPFLAYGGASYASFELWGRYLPRFFLPAWSIRALCGLVVLFGIVRNFSEYPFSWLAPGGLIAMR
jgi:uncharacterized protein DUF2752